jgi:hypothetical protein
MPSIDEINFMASFASIIGLAVSAITYYRVTKLRQEVSSQSINRTIYSLLEEIEKIPITKTELTEKQRNSVNEAIVYIEAFFISWNPFRHITRRRLIKKIKVEIAKTPTLSAENIKRDFRVVRDHIFTLNGK